MWLETINSISPRCIFSPPATGDQIAAVEGQFGVRLPSDLAEVLKEANGIEHPDFDYYILPCEYISEINGIHRTDEVFTENFMPFDNILFIGRDCGGNLFGLPVLNGCLQAGPVSLWDHESDDRTPIAPSVSQYLKYRLNEEANS